MSGSRASCAPRRRTLTQYSRDAPRPVVSGGTFRISVHFSVAEPGGLEQGSGVAAAELSIQKRAGSSRVACRPECDGSFSNGVFFGCLEQRVRVVHDFGNWPPHG